MSERVLSRRSALRSAVVAAVGGVAGYLLARNSPAARAKAGTTAANAYGPATSQGGRRLASVNDVPLGGGLIISDPTMVLTRTPDGQVHGFSSVCTHQGCNVDRVSGGKIACPCHGSTFDASTGAVLGGPAPRPLPMISVVVRSGSIYTS